MTREGKDVRGREYPGSDEVPLPRCWGRGRRASVRILMARRMASRRSLASAAPWAWSLPARPRIRASVSSGPAVGRCRRVRAVGVALGSLGACCTLVVGDQPLGAVH